MKSSKIIQESREDFLSVFVTWPDVRFDGYIICVLLNSDLRIGEYGFMEYMEASIFLCLRGVGIMLTLIWTPSIVTCLVKTRLERKKNPSCHHLTR